MLNVRVRCPRRGGRCRGRTAAGRSARRLGPSQAFSIRAGRTVTLSLALRAADRTALRSVRGPQAYVTTTERGSRGRAKTRQRLLPVRR